MRVMNALLISVVDSPTLRSNSAAFSMMTMRAAGCLRLISNAVAAPENAPPMMATS